jgi:hypothetical protein
MPSRGRPALGGLFIYSDGFDGEALFGIGIIAHAAEAIAGFMVLAKTGVKIAHRVQHGKFFEILFQNPPVVSDMAFCSMPG